MPHATGGIEVKPFPRTSDLDLGAEIIGADLNNLDGTLAPLVEVLVPAT